jgi:GNAT superfamily N-acetyltransferase
MNTMKPSEKTQTLTGDQWLEQVMALHLRVREEMPESQRPFLLPRTPEFFRDRLAGKGGALLGARNEEDRLVGFIAMSRADSFDKACADGRITCPDEDGKLAKAYSAGAVAVAQSLCVLNAFVGRGFSHALLDAAIDWAKQNGCAHLFAQTAAQNVLSWMRFLDKDFAIITAWENGHRRFLLRWLSVEAKAKLLRPRAVVGRHSYSKDYAQMPALMAEINARLAQGRTVFLDNKPGEENALSFVFARRG